MTQAQKSSQNSYLIKELLDLVTLLRVKHMVVLHPKLGNVVCC